MIYRVFFLLSFFSLFTLTVSCQSLKTDSLIQSFLIGNKIVDTIIFNKKKLKNGYVEESNYYTQEYIKVKAKEKIILTGIKFGSNASYQAFVIFDLIDSASHKYFFIGKDGFENDLKKITAVCCDRKNFFSTSHKKRLYSILMNLYVDAELNNDCSSGNLPKFIL